MVGTLDLTNSKLDTALSQVVGHVEGFTLLESTIDKLMHASLAASVRELATKLRENDQKLRARKLFADLNQAERERFYYVLNRELVFSFLTEILETMESEMSSYVRSDLSSLTGGEAQLGLFQRICFLALRDSFCAPGRPYAMLEASRATEQLFNTPQVFSFLPRWSVKVLVEDIISRARPTARDALMKEFWNVQHRSFLKMQLTSAEARFSKGYPLASFFRSDGSCCAREVLRQVQSDVVVIMGRGVEPDHKDKSLVLGYYSTEEEFISACDLLGDRFVAETVQALPSCVAQVFQDAWGSAGLADDSDEERTFSQRWSSIIQRIKRDAFVDTLIKAFTRANVTTWWAIVQKSKSKRPRVAGVQLRCLRCGQKGHMQKSCQLPALTKGQLYCYKCKVVCESRAALHGHIKTCGKPPAPAVTPASTSVVSTAPQVQPTPGFQAAPADTAGVAGSSLPSPSGGV